MTGHEGSHLSATDFKATCLEVLDRLAAHDLERVTVTKRGRPVAVLSPSEPVKAVTFDEFFGSMRGTIIGLEGVDLTQPILEDIPEAEMDGPSG